MAPLPTSLCDPSYENLDEKRSLYRLSLRLEAMESMRLLKDAICVPGEGSTTQLQFAWDTIGFDVDWLGRFIVRLFISFFVR